MRAGVLVGDRSPRDLSGSLEGVPYEIAGDDLLQLRVAIMTTWRTVRCRQPRGSALGAKAGGAGADEMQTTLKAAVESYLRAKTLSRGTRNEYRSTLRKWEQWGSSVPIEELRRKDIREFLDWVYERAVTDE